MSDLEQIEQEMMAYLDIEKNLKKVYFYYIVINFLVLLP